MALPRSTSSVFARILASVLILLAVLFAPFWLYTISIIAAMVYFSFFFAGLVWFFLADLLYGVPEAKFHGAVFVYLTFAALLFALLEFVKNKLRHGAQNF
jgi:hypothetical protein